VTALKNDLWQSLYKFKHFNAVQTQIFFCLFHTDENALVGAPTGSGKTVAAELAMFRVFSESPPTAKVGCNEMSVRKRHFFWMMFQIVYIAPLKALVRERIKDWRNRFDAKLGKRCYEIFARKSISKIRKTGIFRVVELTGDITPDLQALASAQIIVTTPEKWDGISRSWQNRSYVRDVVLIIIDEIHLLGVLKIDRFRAKSVQFYDDVSGEDRGPVLEVIVSRTNFISATTQRKVRVVGLSTALANARDLADWLNIKQVVALHDGNRFLVAYDGFFNPDGSVQLSTVGATSASRGAHFRFLRKALLPKDEHDEQADVSRLH